MQLRFLGAAREVTGSCYLIRAGQHTVLLECGQVQGSKAAEERNADMSHIPVDEIDAVVLSHAHIDHSGRLPLLVKSGYRGPIYTHDATRSLCEIMLADSGYLHEKDAEWENKRRAKRDEPPVEPLYTRNEALAALPQFESLRFNQPAEILPGFEVRLADAGHILGSAIVELTHRGNGTTQRIVFSGDLGHRQAPVMRDPATVSEADLVLMESTYGDRVHRSADETLNELADIFATARAAGGNILIPAFAVGRTQDLLFLLAENYAAWGIDRWQIFLDSPMAIDATEVYAAYRHLTDTNLFERSQRKQRLPNLAFTRSTEESMTINERRTGSIIIAGSGMCTGGRIHHHLKYNVSRPESHLVIVGYQAYGTLGRRLVDGAETIRLWGEEYPVNIQIHTVGGLSAHADRQELLDWYGHFEGGPPVCLVHGEEKAQSTLRGALRERYSVDARMPEYGETIDVD